MRGVDLDGKTTSRIKEDAVEMTEFVYSLMQELTVRIRMTHYFSHGATEWTVYFKNETEHDSKKFSDVKCQLAFCGDKPMLKGIYGDHENLYRPYAFDLERDGVHFQSDSGRATHVNFPYFNLEYGDGRSF